MKKLMAIILLGTASVGSTAFAGWFGCNDCETRVERSCDTCNTCETCSSWEMCPSCDTCSNC